MKIINKNKLYLTARNLSSLHIPGKNNILLLSTPRSGSTWLLEMIAGQPLIRPIRDPLNIRKQHIQEMTAIRSWDDLFSDDHFVQIVEYLKNFQYNLKVDYRFEREKPFSYTWHPITNRLLFKILHGLEHKVNELKKELQAKSLILVRHPIPVTLSRKDLPRLKSYLNSDCRKHFTPGQLKLANEIIDTGDLFEKGILSWCFQNKIFLENSKHSLLVTYEELVIKKRCVLKKISDYLELPNLNKMLIHSKKASSTSSQSSKSRLKILKKVEAGTVSSDKLISKWKLRTTDKMIERTQEILDAFDIEAYKAEKIHPAEDIQLCKNE